MIRACLLLLGVGVPSLFGGERVVLKTGEVFEDVKIEAASNAAYVSLVSEAGMARVAKAALPYELAVKWGFDPVLSSQLIGKEQEARLDLAAREGVRNEVENFWQKNAVELALYCVGVEEGGELSADAKQLGEYFTKRLPSLTALGNRGLGVDVMERRYVALGRIIIEGMSAADEVRKPIWAVRTGTRVESETVYSDAGEVETMERNVPVYTVDKEAAFLSSVSHE